MLIDVVVPVFAGLVETRRCIDSVIASREVHGQPDFELVLIDDSSPDFAIKAYLGELRGTKGITVLENDQNRGFVVTANRGMALHADRDVVLLNSDTEVVNDWLKRLRNCAYCEADIATVTPFSNNATICSFPETCVDNLLPEGLSLSEVDAAFARVNTGKSAEIPTAVGFCMYIRRACITAIGVFDEQSFGRGYGEESDFCRRALKAGWRNLICADTFVYHVGSISFKSEREVRSGQVESTLTSLHPDYFSDVRSFVRRDPLASLRRAVEIELARMRLDSEYPISEKKSMPNAKVSAYACYSRHALTKLADAGGKPVQLHVLHDLGGGVERWCRDYCRADTTRTNLILKPFSRRNATSDGLMLYAGVDDSEAIGLWVFDVPVNVTEQTHPEYAGVIRKIIEVYGVDAVLISSLIGHTLDAMTLGLPTVVIAHDYFPACPAIHLHFDGVCEHCEADRLRECKDRNLDFNPFLSYSAEERLLVRNAYLDILSSRLATVVVPSRGVWNHLLGLFPSLSSASWVNIPHGIESGLMPIKVDIDVSKGKLRVVVLGMLSVSKGMRVLQRALEQLTEFADVYLVGAMEVGEIFLDHPGVHVIPRYDLGELQTVVQEICPHVGLLLSIWPETYSYTLTELMRMGVPTAATRLGGFAERIIDGETGFLFDPSPDAMLECLRRIDADRTSLNRIRKNLDTLPRRSCVDMVADYHCLLPLQAQSMRPFPLEEVATTGSAQELGIRQAVALSGLQKQVKSLELQLSINKEARPRHQGAVQIAERQRRAAEYQLTVAEHHRAVAEQQRAVAEQQRAIAEQHRSAADIQFGEERRQLQERLSYSARALRERDQIVADRDNHIQRMVVHVESVNQQLVAILASTSWRLSSPIRMLGNVVRRSRLLIQCLTPALRNPSELPKKASVLFRALRSGSLLEFKLALLAMRSDTDHQEAWKIYRDTFNAEVRPSIIQAIEGMKDRPLISIIVPTFNTQKVMLRQMLDSVRGQLYPNWELCVGDDCSTESHVRAILKDFARDDPRVKLHFGATNHGVSHVSNRALAMVSGKFVLLLDHDDVLEEQALFRIAQALMSEDPDMIYSDEVMVSPDLGTVLQYAHRPAFSPEFLLGHPYIVHLVGFRTELLRDVGGFDETLNISQDYDLILRISERAKSIVHIPEILYQWRIHGKSAGKQKMADVMETSKAVLQRHLERRGMAGDVHDGTGFNLFYARYPLVSGLRVAIIIPTKNHGELVRQCVESIRATVFEVDYDIVVVDHESDDPATKTYLSSISPNVTVLRYVGPFNFSAINNWAVSHLSGTYSHYLFCNNDIEAKTPGWLERMLELGQHSDVAIVGAQLLYPDRVTIQHAGVCVGAFGAAEHFAKFVRVPDIPRYLGFSEIMASNHEVSAVTAACLLIRQDAFHAVSGFDEALAVGFGDVDLCLRVGQIGYRIMQCPHAELLHHESFTRGKTMGIDPHPADSAFFQARWQWFLESGDPYFNPALYQNSVAWQVRQPMRCSFDVRHRIFKRNAESGKQSFTFNEPHNGVESIIKSKAPISK